MESRTRRRPILLIGDVLHPRHVSAVERLLHGDVHHGAGRARAMPVLLAGRNPHRVAGTDFADRTAPGLHAAKSRHDVEGLAKRMGVPRRAGARLEADAPGPNARRRRRLDDRVLPHCPGEPLAGHPARRRRAQWFDVHDFSSSALVFSLKRVTTRPDRAIQYPLVGGYWIARSSRAMTPHGRRAIGETPMSG